MRTLTKQKVLSTFRELWRERVEHNRALRGDVVAKREAFNNFVDDLHRQRYLTDHQVYNWSNPF